MQLFKTGYQYIFACVQINISLNEWVNIYHECWTIFTEFQRKKTPGNTFILIIFHVQEIGDEKKKTKFTVNAALWMCFAKFGWLTWLNKNILSLFCITLPWKKYDIHCN